jgi:hypothetical protein
VAPQPDLALEVRVHRTVDRFEFMEPVVVELKLTNVSGQPQIVDQAMLSRTDDMTVIIKRQGGKATQWAPFARYCINASPKVLMANESLYGSLFVAAGLNGWAMAEPGIYHVQVALRHDGYDVVSNALPIRVSPPREYDEELLAQDLFTEEVGRALAFNGSRALDKANETLNQVTEQLGDRRVAMHARVALGNPLAGGYKMLVYGERGEEKAIKTMRAEPELARQHLSEALLEEPQQAADTLGHIAYAQQVSDYTAFLAEEGAASDAAEGLERVEDVLKARGVLPGVVAEMASTRRAYDHNR